VRYWVFCEQAVEPQVEGQEMAVLRAVLRAALKAGGRETLAEGAPVVSPSTL